MPQEHLQRQRPRSTTAASTGQQLHQEMLPSKNDGGGILQLMRRLEALKERVLPAQKLPHLQQDVLVQRATQHAEQMPQQLQHAPLALQSPPIEMDAA